MWRERGPIRNCAAGELNSFSTRLPTLSTDFYLVLLNQGREGNEIARTMYVLRCLKLLFNSECAHGGVVCFHIGVAWLIGVATFSW